MFQLLPVLVTALLAASALSASVPTIRSVTGCDGSSIPNCDAGDIITITGSSFTNTYLVSLGTSASNSASDYQCSTYSVVSDTRLTCQLPSVDGSFYSRQTYVTITNPAGSSIPFAALLYKDRYSDSSSDSLSALGVAIVVLGVVFFFTLFACGLRFACGVRTRTLAALHTPLIVVAPAAQPHMLMMPAPGPMIYHQPAVYSSATVYSY